MLSGTKREMIELERARFSSHRHHVHQIEMVISLKIGPVWALFMFKVVSPCPYTYTPYTPESLWNEACWPGTCHVFSIAQLHTQVISILILLERERDVNSFSFSMKWCELRKQFESTLCFRISSQYCVNGVSLNTGKILEAIVLYF